MQTLSVLHWFLPWFCLLSSSVRVAPNKTNGKKAHTQWGNSYGWNELRRCSICCLFVVFGRWFLLLFEGVRLFCILSNVLRIQWQRFSALCFHKMDIWCMVLFSFSKSNHACRLRWLFMFEIFESKATCDFLFLNFKMITIIIMEILPRTMQMSWRLMCAIE